MKHTIMLASLAVSPALFAGKTIDIALKDVPQEIMESAKLAAPTAVFIRANIEVEDDGSRVFEITGNEPEYTFAVAPSALDEIDISAFEDDGFGLQLKKVTLADVFIEVDILDGNVVEEIERVIPARLVPNMVLKRIREGYTGFEPTRIEASYNTHGKIFRYEFEGLFQGSQLDLEVSADGTEIVEADD